MTPKDRSHGPVLAFTAVGLTMRAWAIASPSAARDIATMLGAAIFVLCVLALGYRLGALLERALRG